MNEHLTMLATGEVDAPPMHGCEDSVQVIAMGQVVELVRSWCAAQGERLRLLASAGKGPVDDAVPAWASQHELDLHLLSPGCPHGLTAQQARAERQVWLGAAPQDLAASEAVELCDELALGFADVLLVAWRGPVPGESCRAERLISAAALSMKPVIWVNAAGEIRALDLLKLSDVQRKVLLSSRPSGTVLERCFLDPCKSVQLERWLSEVLGGMNVHCVPPVASGSRRAPHAGRVHSVMLALAQGRPSKAWRALTAQPIAAYRGPTWAGPHDLIAPTVALDSVFDRADVEAAVAAGKYRSAVWISSAASSLAVFAAVAGAIDLWFGGGGAIWAAFEVFLVALIVVLLWRVKHQGWHARWISNRFLAEQLRYTRMGLPVLALGRTVFEPFRSVSIDANGVSRLGVLSTEVRTLQRSVTKLGLPQPLAGGPMVLACEPSIARQQGYVLAVIEDQIAYHERVHADQHAAGHVLHSLTVGLFCLTGAAVLGHFVLHSKWLLIFTAFFPALAAGIHGLGTSLEISRVADQSKIAAMELRSLASAMGVVMGGEDSTWGKWMHLRELTRMAAEVMSDENGQWQRLVNHQKPKLPA